MGGIAGGRQYGRGGRRGYRCGGRRADKVIRAKDGKHTIPYEKLVEAREAEKSAKAEAQALRERIEELEKGAKTRSGNG